MKQRYLTVLSTIAMVMSMTFATTVVSEPVGASTSSLADSCSPDTPQGGASIAQAPMIKIGETYCGNAASQHTAQLDYGNLPHSGGLCDIWSGLWWKLRLKAGQQVQILLSVSSPAYGWYQYLVFPSSTNDGNLKAVDELGLHNLQSGGYLTLQHALFQASAPGVAASSFSVAGAGVYPMIFGSGCPSIDGPFRFSVESVDSAAATTTTLPQPDVVSGSTEKRIPSPKNVLVAIEPKGIKVSWTWNPANGTQVNFVASASGATSCHATAPKMECLIRQLIPGGTYDIGVQAFEGRLRSDIAYYGDVLPFKVRWVLTPEVSILPIDNFSRMQLKTADFSLATKDEVFTFDDTTGQWVKLGKTSHGVLLCLAQCSEYFDVPMPMDQSEIIGIKFYDGSELVGESFKDIANPTDAGFGWAYLKSNNYNGPLPSVPPETTTGTERSDLAGLYACQKWSSALMGVTMVLNVAPIYPFQGLDNLGSDIITVGHDYTSKTFLSLLSTLAAGGINANCSGLADSFAFQISG